VTSPKAARSELKAHALKHDGAWEDHPWDEDVAKVGKKIFVFFGRKGADLGVGVKLPRSLLYARAQRFVQKMGYGMDKSGWIAARFAAGESVPVDLLKSWIDESYEAIAATLPSRKSVPTTRARRPSARKR
jgi:predicted DNA-binding protein (MmcQ/YjbR family)